MPKSVYGPTSENVGSAAGGEPAAIYEVPMGKAKGAQVQVWSKGLVADTRDGAAASEPASRPSAFEVGLKVRNDTPAQITIQPSEVHLILADMPEFHPRETHLFSVDPGKTRELILRYPLPGRFAEKKPDTYQVSWTIHFTTGDYHQVTTFSRQTERGFVPKPLDSGEGADRSIMDGSRKPEPVGIPFGSDPSR